MTGAREHARVLGSGEIPAFGSLLDTLRRTFRLRPGVGRPALDFGYYANVIDLGNNLGLAISTDSVGTKVLIAEMLGTYDTIGIDCVAMNANDIICVGAEPLAMVDFIAVESASGELLTALANGIAEGAERANITIPGGEIAQVPEIIRGAGGDGSGFDLVGTCVGVVPLDRIIVGRDIAPGDAVVGFASSGIHSNGLTLARRALLGDAGLSLNQRVPELGRTLGEELLEPTAMYVRMAVALLNAVDVRALIHVTGDGFLNLRRVEAEVGMRIESLPEPPPIFGLIARAGDVPPEEMYRTFNMGIGFCVVVPEADVSRTLEIARQHGTAAWRIGACVADDARTIDVAPARLRSVGGRFERC